MRDFMVDPSLQAQLLSDGYVTVPMLDASDVRELGSALDRLTPDDGFAPDGTGAFNRSTYHCTFLDTNVDYKRRAQSLISDTFQPKIDQIVVDYRILTGNFYVKVPGRGRFQVHQNWPTTQDLSITTLTVWCPLQDCDESNGTLHIVPGSHKILPDVATPQRRPFFQPFEDTLIQRHLVPVELSAGDALVFDDSLVHWSPENRSVSPRRAVQIETVPREVTPVLYHLDETGPTPRWELYEVGPEFFIDRSIDQVIGRPVDLRLVGTAPFENRGLTEIEFLELLANGPEIRASVYEGRGWPPVG